MRYDVKIDGTSVGTFASADEALARVRQAVAEHPDREPEIIDRTTGRPFAPAASVAERDRLANETGY